VFDATKFFPLVGSLPKPGAVYLSKLLNLGPAYSYLHTRLRESVGWNYI
jgi:hypothetical protein